MYVRSALHWNFRAVNNFHFPPSHTHTKKKEVFHIYPQRWRDKKNCKIKVREWEGEYVICMGGMKKFMSTELGHMRRNRAERGVYVCVSKILTLNLIETEYERGGCCYTTKGLYISQRLLNKVCVYWVLRYTQLNVSNISRIETIWSVAKPQLTALLGTSSISFLALIPSRPRVFLPSSRSSSLSHFPTTTTTIFPPSERHNIYFPLRSALCMYMRPKTLNHNLRNSHSPGHL